LIEPVEKPDIRRLEDIARRTRIRMITMVGRAGAGHLGGSLSAVEMLVALYFGRLRVDPSDPTWEDRDRFVLSKGHNTPLYYAILAERGFFPVSWLDAYDTLGSPLQGHPDMKRTPGVDMTTGSLGQGFSAAVGMSLGARLARKAFRVWVMIGDGEMQEGQVWEAAMYAGARKLERLVCILDHNGLQLASSIEDGLPIAPVADKWRAFGWQVVEVDGNSMGEAVAGLETAHGCRGGPVLVLSHTTKGRGVSFMEGVVKWHSAVPSRLEVARALRELGAPEEDVRQWER
jgi:transketolase